MWQPYVDPRLTRTKDWTHYLGPIVQTAAPVAGAVLGGVFGGPVGAAVGGSAGAALGNLGAEFINPSATPHERQTGAAAQGMMLSGIKTKVDDMKDKLPGEEERTLRQQAMTGYGGNPYAPPPQTIQQQPQQPQVAGIWGKPFGQSVGQIPPFGFGG